MFALICVLFQYEFLAERKFEDMPNKKIGGQAVLEGVMLRNGEDGK